MPYWRLFYHLVWGTKHRATLITPEVEAVLYPVIAEKARELDVIVYAVNGTDDHVHVVAAIPPRHAPAHIVGQLKGRSSYVATHQLGLDFQWQTGYGAHSFSEKNLPWVIRYVDRQKAHHASQTTVLKLEAREDEDNGPPGIAREP